MPAPRAPISVSNLPSPTTPLRQLRVPRPEPGHRRHRQRRRHLPPRPHHQHHRSHERRLQRNQLRRTRTNNSYDVFVRDTNTNTTDLISRYQTALGNDISQLTALSTDGRYVAFNSSATNRVAGDTNSVAEVFVRDLATGTVERISTDSTGPQLTAESEDPSVSYNGRYVPTSRRTQLSRRRLQR